MKMKMKMNDQVDEYFNSISDLADEILTQLQKEVIKLGFASDALILKQPEEAIYRLEKDPYNGQDCLIGDWRDDKGTKTGSLQFNSEGIFFVEQDIIQPHPTDKRWFVEAVNAWGTKKEIKSEARLIANME